MRQIILGGAIAFGLVATSAAIAQPGYNQGGGGYSQGPSQGQGWDRDAFWRGAPQGLRERIDYMQQRINRGMSDGSLDPHEARRAQYTLSGIRRDAARYRYSRDPALRDNLQARLDNLGQHIRWDRHYGPTGNSGAGAERSGYVGQPGGRDPYGTQYDASRDYREGGNYSERPMTANDQVYRGSDGRYYCKHNDGTTGLVIGGIGGAVAGNVIDGGHNRVAGTLIGGALGALVGKSIDQNNSDVRCR